MAITTRVTSATFVKGIIGTNPILSDGHPQIAFIGRSNVGKSSVLNALTEVRGLAKSSSTPGKTREINFFLINHKFYFVDLPGYGFAVGSQEDRETIRKRIVWYFSSGEADIRHVVLILDAVVGPTELDREMLGLLRLSKYSILVIANKADKLKASVREAQLKKIHEVVAAPVIACSTKTNEGIGALLRIILTESLRPSQK